MPDLSQRGVAWTVTFRRYRSSPKYKTETLVIVAPEGRLQLLLDGLRSVHPEAVIDAAESLGEAVWANA